MDWLALLRLDSANSTKRAFDSEAVTMIGKRIPPIHAHSHSPRIPADGIFLRAESNGR